MKVIERALDGVLLLEPRRFDDPRGWFMETYRDTAYADLGVAGPFRQDNVSYSHRGVLRGLHFQNPDAQGKLVSVLQGEVFDVAVDLRVSSPTFGKWFGARLSSNNNRQLWVPAGFAHGFLTLSETAVFLYKCTNVYAPASEGALAWNDPDVGIEWPTLPGGVSGFIVAPKDAAAPRLRDIPAGALFR